jgi:hypothetical protein
MTSFSFCFINYSYFTLRKYSWKKINLSGSSKRKIYFGTRDTPMDQPVYGREWPKKVKIFFCYLIRVEHEKCSETCVWIIRFGQKLRKWDYF